MRKMGKHEAIKTRAPKRGRHEAPPVKPGAGEIIVMIALSAVITAVFALWAMKNTAYSLQAMISACVSAALFCVLALRFIPHWFSDWRCGLEAEREKGAKCGAITVFFAYLVLNAAVMAAAYAVHLAAGGEPGFKNALEIWRAADGIHYLDIARDGYLSTGSIDRLVQLVFLPGYPLAVRAVNFIVGDWLLSGLIVSSLSFAGAGAIFYKLALYETDRAGAARAAAIMAIMPGAFFFAAPMSESLFLLLAVTCAYLARKKKWLPACVAGGAAAFTRSLGLALLVFVLFELIADTVRQRRSFGRRFLQYVCLLIIPAGFGAYVYINYRVTGDPFKFLEYQSGHWFQRLGLFFNSAAYQTEYLAGTAAGGNFHDFFGLWLPNIVSSLAALLIMTAAVRRLRPSYTAFFIVYYVVAIGTTWLLSAPRYLAAMFVLPLALSALTKKSGVNSAVCAVLGAANLAYLVTFVLRWQVW